MPKLTIEDLQKIKDKTRRTTQLREGAGRVKEQDVSDVIVTTSGCAGLCSREPMATVELANEAPVKYVDLTAEKIRKVFKEHVLVGKIVTDYALALGSERTH